MATEIFKPGGGKGMLHGSLGQDLKRGLRHILQTVNGGLERPALCFCVYLKEQKANLFSC